MGRWSLAGLLLQSVLPLALFGSAAVASTPARPDVAGTPSNALGVAAAPDGIWSQLIFGPRRGAAAVYDPARDRVLLFGGEGPGTSLVLLNETWSLALSDGAEWTNVALPFAPLQGRSYASAVYDPVRDRVLVFGGKTADYTYTNEVWELSLGGSMAWSRLTPSGTAPAARMGHSATYDPLRDRMIVFGGSNSNGVQREVWALDLQATAWSRLSPSGTAPSAREGHSAVYDATGDRIVVFGGYGATGLRNDLWALSLATPGWSSLTPSGAVPSARSAHLAVLDAARGRMVVYGGNGGGTQPSALSLSTLTWTAMTVDGTLPPARYGHAGFYDPLRDRLLTFTGWNGSAVLGDVWALSFASTPAWSFIRSEPVPPTRYDFPLVHDTARERVLAWGGFSYEGGTNVVSCLPLNGPRAWAVLATSGTSPANREGHCAIYDPVRDRMLIFGGLSPNLANDLWALSLGGTPTWTRIIAPGDVPSPRYGPSAVYDAARDRVLVFGGGLDVAGTSSDELYELSLAEPRWTRLVLPSPPPARKQHSAIYDPLGDRMIVYGGSSSAAALGDVWSLALSTLQWTPLSLAGGLATYGHSAVYDAMRDRMLVFGGNAGTTFYNALRELSLGETPAWRTLATGDVGPAARSMAGAVYDPGRDQLVLFGGYGTTAPGEKRDTWALSMPAPPVAVMISFARVDATAERVRLEWVLGGGAGFGGTVYRRVAETDWAPLATVRADGTGTIAFDDAAVVAGTRYGYRLGVRDGGAEILSSESWVDVPAAAGSLSLALRANPIVGGAPSVRLTLPEAGVATLGLFDVGGRCLRSRELTGLGAGVHEVKLDGAPLRPGVYVVRLALGMRSVEARLVMLR